LGEYLPSQSNTRFTLNNQATYILESMSDGFTALDTQWRYTYVNRAAETLLQKKREEVLGKSVWDIFPEAIGSSFWQKSHEAVETQNVVEFEELYPPQQQWARVRICPSKEGIFVYLQDITAFKQAEKEADETLALLVDTLLVDTAPIGFAFFDTGFRFRRINKRLADINGLPPQEHIGKTIGEVIPSMEELTPQVLHTVLETGEPVLNFEITGATPAALDTIKHWLASYYPVRSQRGKILGIGMFLLDITGRKQTEEALRQSEERLRIALKDTPITAYQHDKDLRYTWIYNPLPVFSPEVIIGKDDADFIAPEEAAHLMGLKRRVVESGIGIKEEIKTTSDAGLRYFDLVIEPLYDSRNNVIGVTGASVDITERKLAEQALQASEIRFRRLFEAGIIGVAIADATGTIYDSNDVFLDMIGYKREEILNGQVRWNNLSPPEYQEAEARVTQQILATGEFTPHEKEYRRKDGSLFPALVGGTVIDREKLLVVVFILDISERKELEKRKDEFISIVSHELKTPITTLKGFTQLLKRQLEKQGMDEPVISLSKMEKQINNLTKLIEELLDVSKIQVGKLAYAEEAVDIDVLIHDIAETIQHISPTHMISIQGASRRKILGDSDRLGQVFTNLITNAIKYSPEADTVDIDIVSSQDSVIISIRDYGVGIPKEHRSKIFDRFYRVYDDTAKTFPGLGMGLYISHEIIQRHGGEITVESEEGKGSTFTVTLPFQT
jgi:PAS domain S-box-containing protein